MKETGTGWAILIPHPKSRVKYLLRHTSNATRVFLDKRSAQEFLDQCPAFTAAGAKVVMIRWQVEVIEE